MTNIALLLALDPEIPALLKGLVCMAGWYFNNPAPEWNVRCDPHAAAMVFRSEIREMVAVGIDVTDPCRMPADECRARFRESARPFDLVAKMADIWFRDRPVLRYHDPLAAAIVFEPEICGYVERVISVDLLDSDRLGRTEAREYEGHVRRIASRVDVPRFFDHYFGVVGMQPSAGG
jgi:purine nucleosidase